VAACIYVDGGRVGVSHARTHGVALYCSRVETCKFVLGEFTLCRLVVCMADRSCLRTGTRLASRPHRAPDRPTDRPTRTILHAGIAQVATVDEHGDVRSGPIGRRLAFLSCQFHHPPVSYLMQGGRSVGRPSVRPSVR